MPLERKINDKFYEEMRALANQHQIKFATAKQQPRLRGNVHPSWLPKSDVVVIDYITLLN